MNEIESTAKNIMQNKCESLVSDFVNIVLFSLDNPNLAVKQRKTKSRPEPVFGTAEHLEWLADKFIKGHRPKQLPQPKTVPDPALSNVMIKGYGVKQAEVSSKIEGHRTAMVAENVVGELLERYLYKKLDKEDWIWCAGEVVKNVDFIRRVDNPEVKWESLQIKNRDNSENAASSSVRQGTTIKKWYRTVSRTGETKWESFPVNVPDTNLSEEDFRTYINSYLSK